MLDYSDIHAALAAAGMDDWIDTVAPLCQQRLEPSAHGDLPRWHAALEALPEVERSDPVLNEDVVRLGRPLPAQARLTLTDTLQTLSPWRKGPFDVCGVSIDTEWQSHLKWNRVRNHLEPLTGRQVLDVGSGNGYYALRMAGAGARSVIGIDPTILYVVQFAALKRFAPTVPVQVLPLRLHELPPEPRVFDTTFSMGVLYHQHSPIDHLRQLRGTLRPGGQLVLETLFLPGEASFAFTPPGRYARMKNVWLLPTIVELRTWLARCGYRDIAVVDASQTTIDEQRSTDWMPFESLAEALDPAQPDRTVEGWPAPRRVVVTATVP